VIQAIVSVIVVLSILIFFHELGHFLVARRLGVKVLKFSLGFGPKLIGRQIGETEYLISAFPLGGYVKLLGEDPTEATTPEDEARSFSSQSVGRRIAIVAAGPVFNFILAFLIFVAAFSIGFPNLSSQIGEVQKGAPAEQAGLKPGDVVVAIEGKPVMFWDEIKVAIQKYGGKEIRLAVVDCKNYQELDRCLKERAGSQQILKLAPKEEEAKTLLGDKIKEWRIGVSPKGTFITKRYDPMTATVLGAKRTWEITKFTVLGIVRLIERRIPANTIGGPILIAQLAGQQASEGLINISFFIAILSINLGVINFLPIPILDGGHLLFFIIEAVMGRPVSLKKREVAQQVGLFILLALMFFAFYNDIMRLLKPGS
jgi:regulator of sigma E protease